MLLGAELLHRLRDMLGVDLRPVREEGSGAFGPAWNCRKQISITAPMSATSLACAMVRPGTLVRPWVMMHVLHAELAAALHHGDDLLGMHVAGGEHAGSRAR